MPKIVGKSTRVVETEGFSIDEYAGNVSSKDDQMSLAVVKVTTPYSEPFLTLHYDEWIAVIKGQVDCHVFDEDTQTEVKAVSAVAGETIFIEKGQRFKPVFPVANTEYVPVCIPAFKPERCIREDDADGRDKEEEQRIVERLADLHKDNANGSVGTHSNDTSGTSNDECSLYHMCEESSWKAAVDSDTAYFPPTFVQDGGFTHATSIPEKLIETANHFYTSSKDNWICLKLCNAKTLKKKCGIVTIFEEPKPVGSTDVKDEWKKENADEGDEAVVIFPHIYGGIPVSIPGIIADVYPMQRDPDNGTFLSIEGLTK
eukprot:jgi/Psemu1/196337/e_gw1.185.53.1